MHLSLSICCFNFVKPAEDDIDSLANVYFERTSLYWCVYTVYLKIFSFVAALSNSKMR